jgi:Tol biopolymer transport system component
VNGNSDWARVKEVFQSALDQPADLRSAFVADACGSDGTLRSEVESLLDAHDAAGAFAAGDAVASLIVPDLDELSAADPDFAPGSHVGVYAIVSCIGRGSMGQVFKAVDSRLDRTVALKVLAPDLAPDAASRARFTHEARTIASLSHPHICALFDVGDHPRFDYFVMEYLEGETLSAVLRRGRLSVDTACQHAAEIISALDAAHRLGVVHRDLKPANVMITPSGVKLLDFGIAKTVLANDGSDGAAADAAYATRYGSVIGTAGYMSPEQARGQAVDKRGDIWAFGCLLFEMLSGRPAFARDTLADTFAMVLEREPEWSLLPATTPKSLVRVMRRCLEKDPARRLRDIADARADIDDRDEPGPGARSAPGIARAVRFVPWVIAVGAVALAAIVTMPHTSREAGVQPPFRLAVVPPPGTTLTPFDLSGAPQFALSPDGRQIALVVTDTTRVARLWLRELNSPNGRFLSGTEHATGPFWSPSGSALGFFADRKLKKVLIQSGVVQELAEAPRDVSGGAWSAGGTILFAGPGTGLRRVSDEGGPVTAATTVNTPGGELGHGWPQFLPDGRRFLFYVRHRDRAASGAYVSSVDVPGQRLVLTSTARAVYSATGHLLFEQAGTLMAQAFDEASASVTGQPVALPDRVVALLGPAWLPVSAGGDAVGYWNGDGRPTFDLKVVDRSGHTIRQVLPPGQYLALDLSPDGSRALVTQRIDSQTDTLSTVDLKTAARVQVTLAPGVAHFGIWSPLGDEVIFSSLEGGAPRLYRKNVRGDTPEVAVVPSVAQPNMFPSDWSRDGWVLYSAPGPSAWDIFALRMKDSTVHPVAHAPQNQIQGRLSPNGRWIAYASDESGRFEVYVQSFRDASDRRLVSSNGGSQPTWRRDGRELFYVAADGTLMAVAVASEPRFDNRGERALFQTESQQVLAPFTVSYAPAADGKTFLVRSELPVSASRTISVITNALSNRPLR